MPKVTYVAHDGARSEIDVPEGDNVMQGAVFNAVDGIVGECGGALACATCHCYIDEAWVDRVGGSGSQEESDMLGIAAGEINPNSRLGCQIALTQELDGLIIHMPESQY